MTVDRSRIITLIQALRARAADEASSQSEVSAAAQRVAKLIATHEVTESELRQSGDSAVERGRYNEGRKSEHEALKYAAQGIAALSECRVLCFRGEFAPYGFPADVQFALYLFELVEGASTRAWKAYAKTRKFRNMRKSRKDFLAFFGGEIATRFIDKARERQAARSANYTGGTSIVILKNQLIDSHIADKFGDIRKRRSRQGAGGFDYHAARAAQLAASQISIERPIETNQTTEDLLT